MNVTSLTLKLRWYRAGVECESLNPTRGKNGIRGSKLMILKNLTFSQVSIKQYDGLELVGIDVILPTKRPVRIIRVYVSPRFNNSIQTRRRQIINNLREQLEITHPSFLVGDFNAKMQIPQHTHTNPLGDELTELNECGKIRIHIPSDFTTYDPGGRDPSVLDLLICNPQPTILPNGTHNGCWERSEATIRSRRRSM